MFVRQLFELRQPLTMGRLLRIGTRGSQLALWQANWVRSQLRLHHPSIDVRIVTIKTKGDKILDVPLAKVGGKGLFVKEIEEALLAGHVDLAVHSMKDMPAEIPDGLCIGPVPQRENPADALISRDGISLSEIHTGARIGTSSLRRAAQLRHFRPDLKVVSLRGNLDTRLRKLNDPQHELDAIVVAAAGIHRLGLTERITEIIDYHRMLPAAGQGALCIELRSDDAATSEMLSILNHPATRAAVMAERAFLHRLGGSCQIPIAAHADIRETRVKLEGLVADVDGRNVCRDRHSGSTAAACGIELAERLLALGADRILKDLTSHGI
jgi:hydroxymethylbilane synthase